MFGLPTQNKSSAINASLSFLLDLLKEKNHISRKIKSRTKYLNEKSVLLLFWFAKNQARSSLYNNKLNCLRFSDEKNNQENSDQLHYYKQPEVSF